MARAPAELDRLRTITQALQTLSPHPAPVLPTLMGELRALLGADAAVAYSVKVGQGTCELAFVHGHGLVDDYAEISRRWFAEAPIPWGLFDPTRPAPAQRNSVRLLDELGHEPDRPPPVIEQLFPLVGLANKDQLRVLICEEDCLLAWVGAFREEPFSSREAALLAQLVRPLQERLSLEQRLSQGAVLSAALHCALEQVGTAAFLLSPRGRVVEQNSAARAQLAADPALEQTLAATVRGMPTSFQLSVVTGPGMADHYLAVQRPQPRLATEAAARVAPRWRLTPRQTEVMALLAEGLSNRAIATRLGCSESTVEIHVSAVLAKAEVESRAALVARIWSQA
ncbi:MAG: LuxR C-terminal-related transcriptional regulator [Myxococcota bacterium]|nr:LuxR C-terminal-related transcriptional regulator [Myxococcota bacterium]